MAVIDRGRGTRPPDNLPKSRRFAVGAKSLNINELYWWPRKDSNIEPLSDGSIVSRGHPRCARTSLSSPANWSLRDGANVVRKMNLEARDLGVDAVRKRHERRAETGHLLIKSRITSGNSEDFLPAKNSFKNNELDWWSRGGSNS